MRRVSAIAVLCLCGPAFAGGYTPFARGLDANNRGDSEAAIRYFDAALAAGDLAAAYLPSAYVGRARAQLLRGSCGRALSDLDRAIHLKPDYADAFSLRTEASRCRGEATVQQEATPPAPASVYQSIQTPPSHPMPASWADQTCRAEQSITLTPDWFGGMTVAARIGGQERNLLIDTGGVTSMLTRSTVSALGLAPEALRDERVTLYGGLHLSQFVRVNATDVGGVPGPANFYVLPDNRLPYALSGTLAPDFLSRFDVEFDFANARMNLFAPGACPLAASGAVGLASDANHHLIVPVEIDGHTIPAMLDTGASRSEISLETARSLFGPMPDLRAANRSDAEPGLAAHPFRTLTVAGVQIADPDILVAPDAVSRRPAGAPRLVIGQNLLRRLHLFISYSRNMLVLARAD
jgi:predicted aspartyl protease